MMEATQRAEVEQLIELAEEVELNEWEEEFLHSIRNQLANPLWTPTERQLEKLEEIAAKRAPF
jgi:hypothetical protein